MPRNRTDEKLKMTDNRTANPSSIIHHLSSVISHPSSLIHHPSSARSHERGNIFVFILIGIVLFAALSMTISRGMQTQTSSNMSAREVELAAVDIISYSQKIERAVNRMRRSGVSENNISFSNSVVTGYTHGSPQADTNKIFNKSGGGLQWQSPANGVNDGSEWIITGSTCIADVGTGATGCDSDSSSNEELLLVLPNVKESVCEKIDEKLGISSIPADSGGGPAGTKFVGTFADDTEIIPAGSSYTTACISYGGNYYFYTVLIER